MAVERGSSRRRRCRTASGVTTLTLGAPGGVASPQRSSRESPNAIRTTRFTPISWLPKSLYWQFHRAANIYFVVIALVSCIPWVEAKWQPKVLTVVLILLAQALKDLYEDVKRWSDDKEVNTSLVDRFDAKTGTFKEVMWREVDAGDLCLITGGSTFPADTLVLASADQSGVFFVGTKSMDGETNLKERSVPSAVSELVASMSPASLRPWACVEGAQLWASSFGSRSGVSDGSARSAKWGGEQTLGPDWLDKALIRSDIVTTVTM